MSRIASRVLLGLAIYIGGWYGESGTFQALQIGAVALLVLAGLFALLSYPKMRLTPSLPECILGGAYAFGMLVAFIRGNTLSFFYGLMFLLVLISVSLQVRQKEGASIDVVFQTAYLALLASILALQSESLLNSVTGTVRYGVGLVRFEPLGMHPNLSGLVYGGGSLLFLRHALTTSQWKQKLFSIFVALLCISVVLAASARASLLAMGICVLVAIVVFAWRGSYRARWVLISSAFIGVSIVLLNPQAISGYLVTVLDLESSTRGLASGATGRTEIWQNGIELALSDPLLLFTGRGVRAAIVSEIGFPVESSFINLALEHGLVFGSLIALGFIAYILLALSRSTRGGKIDAPLLLSGLMLLFIVVQSIFNRYLIAVGNPYSLMALFVLLRLSIGAQAKAATVKSSSPLVY